MSGCWLAESDVASQSDCHVDRQNYKVRCNGVLAIGFVDLVLVDFMRVDLVAVSFALTDFVGIDLMPVNLMVAGSGVILAYDSKHRK
jgi:hypothetical protein